MLKIGKSNLFLSTVTSKGGRIRGNVIRIKSTNTNRLTICEITGFGDYVYLLDHDYS